MSTCKQFSAEEFEKLDNLVVQMERYANKKNHKMVVDTGGDFHDLLISKSDNVELLEYTDRLSLKLHIQFFKHWSTLYSPAEIGRRHRVILDSVKSGDSDLIERVVRQHYAETGKKIATL
jgi:DNA-binding GntR family transcriptional regulator